ncbi:MAG: glutamyl-tRNA reductase [Pirellulaceae bacterium]
MQCGMIGWTYHQTPVELRERLAFSQTQVARAQEFFKNRYQGVESVLLSTCNRVELYFASDKGKELPSADDVGQFVSEFHGIQYNDIAEQAIKLTGEQMISHLFTVASSLDSMVVGEVQILSQVKSAYELACAHGTVSTHLHPVFQRASFVAKRIATETSIHHHRVSVPSVAVSEIATEFFESFEDKGILLIGAGEMGTETIRYLVDKGANRITVVNRSAEKAFSLAEEFRASHATWDRLYELVSRADLIVSTTGADRPIIELAEFKKSRGKRSAKAVLLLDLAVPRDIDTEVGDLPDVYLYTVDDLQEVCDRNLEARKREWPKAHKIVEQETTKFLSDDVFRGSGHTIKQLRSQAEQIKSHELERLLNKMDGRGLDDSLRKEVEVSFDRLVNKLLHPPLKSLRESADSANHGSMIAALRKLFRLQD